MTSRSSDRRPGFRVEWVRRANRQAGRPTGRSTRHGRASLAAGRWRVRRRRPGDASVLRSGLLLRLVGVLAAAVLGCVGATEGDQGRIGSWGLIQALPALYFVGLTLLIVMFFIELARGDHSSNLVLAANMIGVVVLLHGAPGFLEQEPRFSSAWLHVGFTEQILHSGASAPAVDARFNWPGFFGAAAAVTGAGGLSSALPFVRWTPILMVLLYLPAIYLIGRQLTASRTATWLGLLLFVLVNWVGQDYFAPQTVGYVLFLMSVAVMVTFFRSGPQLHLGSRLTAWRDRLAFDGVPDIAVGHRVRIALVALLVLIQAALATTHPLSPIMAVLASTALVLAGRLRIVVFPLIAAVLTLGWISVGATTYWVGHLHTIFGDIGNVESVVNKAVGERLAGSSSHLALVQLRVLFTGAVWAVAALSAAALWIRRRPPLTLIALSAAPFVTLAQDYGNEGVMRIFLFSAPFACLLISQALETFVRWRPLQLLAGALALALVPVFLLTRFGNESFEQVRGDEIQAVKELYRIAPPDSELISPTSQVAWRSTHATDYRYHRPRDAEGFRRGDLGAIRRLGRSEDAPGTYLIVTTSQIVYAHESLNAPADWFDKVLPELTPENGYRLVYQNPDARIYEFRAP